MSGLKLTALAAVIAAFLIAPTALLADEPSRWGTDEDTVAYDSDEPAEAALDTDTDTEATPATADPVDTAEDTAEEVTDAEEPEATADDEEEVTEAEDQVATEDDGKGATATASATTAVSIGDFFYRPQDVTVHTGDTVDWTNDGTVPEGHTVTGDGFDSGVIEPGGTYAHTFAEAGSFDYVCTLHPNMRGTVTVTGSPAAGTDDTTGGSGTGAVPSAVPTTSAGSADDSSGALASTGLNLILLAEIGGCLLATGMLVYRLRYGWPF